MLAPSTALADTGPGPLCTGWPTAQTLIGGSTLWVTGQAQVAHQFGAVFNGVTRTATTQYFSPSFQTPVVTSVKQFGLHVTCSGVDGSTAWDYTIILLPRGWTGRSAPAAHHAGAKAIASAESRPSALITTLLWSVPVLVVVAALVLGVRRPRR